jgi:hypothetical protein
MTKFNNITPKYILPEKEPKIGEREIKLAYFKSWYLSCKDIHNKNRRKKRRGGKGNGDMQ